MSEKEIKEDYKNQLADIILRGHTDNALDIISPIIKDGDGMSFLVGDLETRERYKIRLKIEEF